MKYKTELHCHTGDVSNCGKETAEYIVSRYIEAGYTSLVVANHMSFYTFTGSRKKYPEYLEKTGKSDCWQSKVDFFMTGYENLVKAADGLTVFADITDGAILAGDRLLMDTVIR